MLLAALLKHVRRVLALGPGRVRAVPVPMGPAEMGVTKAIDKTTSMQEHRFLKAYAPRQSNLYAEEVEVCAGRRGLTQKLIPGMIPRWAHNDLEPQDKDPGKMAASVITLQLVVRSTDQLRHQADQAPAEGDRKRPAARIIRMTVKPHHVIQLQQNWQWPTG